MQFTLPECSSAVLKCSGEHMQSARRVFPVLLPVVELGGQDSQLASVDRPGFGLKVLARHAVGCALPVGAKKPGATDAHCPAAESPVELPIVPPSQAMGIVAPLGQKYPRQQISHAVMPSRR